MKPISSVIQILNQNDETLFLLRVTKPLGWGLPGGHIEEGETPEQGCVRELMEETGIDLSVDDIIFIGHAIAHNNDVIAIYKGYYDTSKGEIKLRKSEHSAYGWFKHIDEDSIHFAGRTWKFYKKAIMYSLQAILNSPSKLINWRTFGYCVKTFIRCNLCKIKTLFN